MQRRRNGDGGAYPEHGFHYVDVDFVVLLGFVEKGVEVVLLSGLFLGAAVLAGLEALLQDFGDEGVHAGAESLESAAEAGQVEFPQAGDEVAGVECADDAV